MRSLIRVHTADQQRASFVAGWPYFPDGFWLCSKVMRGVTVSLEFDIDKNRLPLRMSNGSHRMEIPPPLEICHRSPVPEKPAHRLHRNTSCFTEGQVGFRETLLP